MLRNRKAACVKKTAKTLKLDKTQMITLLDLFGALKDMAPKGAEPEGEAHAAQ